MSGCRAHLPTKGNSFDLYLRLDPDQLAAGGPPDDSWDIISSTVNVAGKSRTGSGGVRVVPHEPDQSLLVKLLTGSPKMPYLDTVQVNYADSWDVGFVRSWIGSMTANPSDAGAVDAGTGEDGTNDAGADAGGLDGGASDAATDGGPGSGFGEAGGEPPDAAFGPGARDAGDAGCTADAGDCH